MGGTEKVSRLAVVNCTVFFSGAYRLRQMTVNQMQKLREGFRDHLDQKARLMILMTRRDQSAGGVLGVLEKIPWKDLLMLKSGGQCCAQETVQKTNIEIPCRWGKPQINPGGCKHVSGLAGAGSLGQLLHLCRIHFAPS